MPGKHSVEKKNKSIWLKLDTFYRAQEYVNKQGISLNEFIGDAVKERLDKLGVKLDPKGRYAKELAFERERNRMNRGLARGEKIKGVMHGNGTRKGHPHDSP